MTKRSVTRIALVTTVAMALPLGGGSVALAAPDSSSQVTVQAVPMRRAETPGSRSADQALQARLTAAITRAVGDRADDVSVVVHDRRSGVTVRHNPSLRNCTGSIVKALVLVGLVRARRADGRTLSNSERSLARRMITMSDNDATSALIARLGGRGALQRAARQLGMTRTQVAGSWGRTMTTASDQALLIDKIVDGEAFTDRDDQAYVLDLMGKVVPEQAWGVGSVPEEADVALKNGWVPLTPRGWRVNSIGHVSAPDRDYTLTMLSYDNGTMAQGVTVLDAVSKAVYRTLGTSGGSTAKGAQQVTFALPQGAPEWLVGPGTAFPPYPAW